MTRESPDYNVTVRFSQRSNVCIYDQPKLLSFQALKKDSRNYEESVVQS